MALIKCPECGKEVSDKAVQCIHCGFPLNTIKHYPNEGFTLIGPDKKGSISIHCNICNNILSFDKSDFLLIYEKRVVIKTPISCPYCTNRQERGEIKLTEEEIQAIEEREDREWDERAHRLQTEKLRPKCPRCGSTSITTGPRGVNGFWGFIGASKTVNRCANCGHTWTPRG